MTDRPYRLAVDIGGTFVDAMELDQRTGHVRFRKASTTPAEPWKGVLAAIEALGTDLGEAELFIHGTTLGLNAVLERRGGATGIITNAGLRDIFLIGRGNVPDDRMYDFQYQRPPSLVQRRHTAGVTGRLDHRGDVVTPLDESELREVARHLVEDEGVISVAVCFVHSYRNPASEQRAAELLREWYPDLKVSVSTDIVQEYREYERTSTTVLEAYIRPIFERYVDELERGLADRGFDSRFLIMRSGGGSMTSATAKLSPTPTVLSGPAGGIVGAAYLAEALGRDKVLTFDIGGTSLDACVIEGGNAVVTHEAELEHFPLLIPTYDIRTIGAGGGSIASIERGLLKVGPRSASAVPGPVAYGRGGTEPTVTDASVALGYVDPDSFLSGEMRLHDEEAVAALREQIAEPLGLDVSAAAAGIFDVMLAKTVGAVRQITVERGHDPRDFSLLAFGGAGPLVAPLLAREMGVGEVIVPFAPSGFSAWGMLSADVVTDFSRTRMEVLGDSDPAALSADLDAVGELAFASLEEQGVPREHGVLERQLELRYLGQEHTLLVDVGERIDAGEVRAAFDELHRARYGHAMDNPVQILTLRVRGVGRTTRPALGTEPAGDPDASGALVKTRRAYDFGSRAMTDFAVYDRSRLRPGHAFAGPALVDEGTSTTVVHSGQRVAVEEHGYLLITPEAS
ncbi:hydantoinase/oxoprolinase family protein [Agromyces aerolatus]|uniref:hydantoinase/oxoprolinase family protein n=1 Tax=Agromyces sp. LY-1074 TaxID=3074080 RepID=UPI002854386F|nr:MULTISPECIES: hydantoinase/oxoprolinase family protein [unclassified Agromyces]MDR5698338.1 hydantoinase/oxoprolinase family protein [Agromyces sp. LY-1074]MDR5704632.1 hydantoinase/oxoprolinase family protein [Agromyces sp. LY-1358]